VCPALSAVLQVLHVFGILLRRSRWALQQQEYGRFFVGRSIDMTCINVQFAVQDCLVASAFEHAAAGAIPTSHLAPNAGPSHHTPSAQRST
jgi:hypothetical protein